jgi:hypothetical protein
MKPTNLIELCARLIGWSLALVIPAAGLPATVTLDNLSQTYNGGGKTPSVVTEPAGLGVSWRFVDPTAGPPQPVTETVFRNVPNTLALSYSSIGFSATSTWGLGDYVQVAGTARNLESVDVVMVTWAKAANYPVEAAADASGWRHPITLRIYDMNASGVLGYKGEITREIFVPWRPLTLPNGSSYPYKGYAFAAHFDFSSGLVLPERPVIMVAYDTQSAGFEPIGSPGPYNELNVALGGSPTIGSDMNSSGVLWVRSASIWTYPAVDVPGSPMFTVKTNRIPEPGTAEPPVDAGSWQATATITAPGYEGSATGTLVIGKAAATITLGNLTAVCDGSAKPVSVTTEPAGLTVAVTYDGAQEAPQAKGKYVVSAVVEDTNYHGTNTGELWLGNNLASWLNAWVVNGNIDAGATGDNDDPDGDGLSNMLEYGLGLDPSSATPNLPGEGAPQVAYDNGQLSLIYRKNLTATDLEFKVESTTRLGGAEAWSVAATADTVIASEGLVQTIRATLAVDPGDTQRFVRLRVVRR